LIIYSVDQLLLLPVIFIYFSELLLGFVAVLFKRKHELIRTHYVLL